ncbi:FtsX-like permease family protein [Streptomyces sp. HPF1205]|uniref:FtsX-like permease family protein n=1 Tax=Streptomyces sp. HPF1205 TaxID=2873262 RepID=UPI001CED1FEF|nr:ABC transporter permease [Streptomyces sp. HPF1205]
MTGFVLMRVRAHRALLAAALLTVVLTASVLATFTAFTGSIGDAALRRTLGHQAADRATVEAQASLNGPAGPVDGAVRKVLGGSFGGLPTTVLSTTRSGPYGLPPALRPPGAARTGDPLLTLLGTFDRSRLVLVSGAWPAPAAAGAPEVPVAVPAVAAQALKARPGQVITLVDRLGGPRLRIRVTGVYRPRDRTAAYWHLDPLAGRGVRTVGYTTYGPMLVDGGTFASGRVRAAEMSWQAVGDFRTVTTGRMGALADSVRHALAAFRTDPAASSAQPSSDLPALVSDLRRSLLVSRSTLLIGALQLVVLAGFALLLVARLLAEERAGETALLRARGGSRARVAWLAAAEALLLALPAAVVAPLLAGPVTRLLGGTGAMARTGASLGGGSTGAAWLVAVCTALACAGAVIAPALRAGGAYAVERAARSRRRALPGALQAGADVALLAVAGVAYWQLQRRSSGGGALSATASGGLGVDPVLVTAPALCLLAGTVLVLRLLPLVARLGERRAARGRALAPALAGWQLARRPQRGAGAALLLVLAVAMGVFAIGQGASWDRSQHDQADFAVGADIRVTGTTTPPFGQAGIYAAAPDVTAAAPATRDQLPLSGDRHATLLAIDTERAARAMRFRPDLTGGRPVADVLRPLRAGAAAAPAGFALPASARKVVVDATLDVAGGAPPGQEPDHLTMVVEDAYGVVYDLLLGDVPPDGAPHPLALDLAAASGTAGGAPAGPLRLIRVDAAYSLPSAPQRHRLTLGSPVVTVADGTSRPLATAPAPAASSTASSAASSTASSATPSTASSTAWSTTAELDDPSLAHLPGETAPSVSGTRAGGAALLTVTYDTGAAELDPMSYQTPPTVTLRARASSAAAPPLAAVATDTYLRAVGAKVGDVVKVPVNGVNAQVRIAAAVRAVPATGDTIDALGGSAGPEGSAGTPDGGAGGTDAADAPGGSGGAGGSDKDAGTLLLDLRAVNRTLEAAGALPMQPTEWWLATRPGTSARVAAALRDRTDVDSLLVRDERAAELRADPLGAGPQSALPAAVVAAAVLAAVGFTVSAVGAIRERDQEFAVLRALGAPRRGLARVIAAEQGLLVLVSMAVGVGLGTLLTRLVTPLIILTGTAGRPVPDLLVELPAGRLAQLLAVVLVAPLLVVLATAMRRGDPATALRRQGED